jgi:hypothetical protein
MSQSVLHQASGVAGGAATVVQDLLSIVIYLLAAPVIV